jgi:hypothetical protein
MARLRRSRLVAPKISSGTRVRPQRERCSTTRFGRIERGGSTESGIGKSLRFKLPTPRPSCSYALYSSAAALSEGHEHPERLN